MRLQASDLREEYPSVAEWLASDEVTEKLKQVGRPIQLQGRVKVSLYVEGDMAEQLDAAAKRRGVSRSEIARKWIKRGMKR